MLINCIKGSKSKYQVQNVILLDFEINYMLLFQYKLHIIAHGLIITIKQGSQCPIYIMKTTW